MILKCNNAEDAAQCVDGTSKEGSASSGSGSRDELPACCHWRRSPTVVGGVGSLRDWVVRRALPPASELTVNGYNVLRGTVVVRDLPLVVMYVLKIL